jgi:hypothetical protein
MRGANILGAVLPQSLPFEAVLEGLDSEWVSIQAFEVVDVFLGGAPEVSSTKLHNQASLELAHPCKSPMTPSLHVVHEKGPRSLGIRSNHNKILLFPQSKSHPILSIKFP